MSRESALVMHFDMHLEKNACNVMMKVYFCLSMRLYVCIWLASFSTEFMPKDLDMAGGDGPAATHGVGIVSMMGLAWSPMGLDGPTLGPLHRP
jgi:hypothetical protein